MGMSLHFRIWVGPYTSEYGYVLTLQNMGRSLHFRIWVGPYTSEYGRSLHFRIWVGPYIFQNMAHIVFLLMMFVGDYWFVYHFDLTCVLLCVFLYYLYLLFYCIREISL